MLQLKKIKKSYFLGNKKSQEEVEVLKGIDLHIKKWEFIAIMWPSWSGKSTLMNIIWMLDTPTSWHYYIDDIRVDGLTDFQQSKIRREKIGFVFQNYSLIPRLSNLDQVMLPLIYQWVALWDARKRSLLALEQVWLKDKADWQSSELSGGQKQRVSIARALVVEPSLILADEPTWALDSVTWKEILEIFKDLHTQWNTIIMITHDLDVANLAQRIIHIKDGNIGNKNKKWI